MHQPATDLPLPPPPDKMRSPIERLIRKGLIQRGTLTYTVGMLRITPKGRRELQAMMGNTATAALTAYKPSKQDAIEGYKRAAMEATISQAGARAKALKEARAAFGDGTLYHPDQALEIGLAHGLDGAARKDLKDVAALWIARKGLPSKQGTLDFTGPKLPQGDGPQSNRHPQGKASSDD